MATAIMVGSVIGKGLLAGALGDLYVFIKSSVYKTQLEDVLKELDIQSELDIVQALLHDLEDYIECRVVKVSSDQVKESVTQIHAELKNIQNELHEHKSRFMADWRSPNCNGYLKNLKNHRDVLRKRRQLLISVLGVQKALYKRKEPVKLEQRGLIERFFE